ncbi:hypothetical protein HU200_035682 [Digitaria exilis]|uniref:DUF569 domain-containing protein n=1 Tax=Digitaria exilis TaxID=1010633 RepID=A0A835BIF3_9POAL|nr:hypothetical protein HU200_035682 [Digitaria exilis]
MPAAVELEVSNKPGPTSQFRTGALLPPPVGRHVASTASDLACESAGARRLEMPRLGAETSPLSLPALPPPPRSTAAPTPPSASAPAAAAVAMELFPDGAHVRLRSRVHGTYLHADADGEGVSTSSQRASLNGAWAVHRLGRGGEDGGAASASASAYVLLRSAAYGRYLGLWAHPAPPLGVVHLPVLRVYEYPEQDDVLWVAVGAADESGDVLLRHGRHATSFLGVNADSHGSQRAHWVTEAADPSSPSSGELAVPLLLRTFLLLSRPMVLWRTITYVRADDEGNFDPHPLARRRFIFYGRSVFQLTGVLSILLREWFFGIRLCVRAGSQGRLTPLVIDLPANEQPMDIVVLTAGSPALADSQRTRGTLSNYRHARAHRLALFCSSRALAQPTWITRAHMWMYNWHFSTEICLRPHTPTRPPPRLKCPSPLSSSPWPCKPNATLLLPPRTTATASSSASARRSRSAIGGGAMDFLPDGAHVRLQSLVRGTFLHADEDGRGVSLTGRRETISTAWQAHRVTGEDGNPYVLLLCSAYGRYLAVSPAASPHGHRDRRAFQNAYNDPHQPDIIWEGVAVGDHVFLMRHGSGCLLRANGDEQRWVNGLSVDDASNQSTMTHWKVEAIPPRALAPALPLPTPVSSQFPSLSLPGTALLALIWGWGIN